MEKDNKILRKIKKLLALSKSSNPHEAAKALEMAQKLMQENQINQDDIEITEVRCKGKFAYRTPRYIHMLVSTIKIAFGCEAYLVHVNKTTVIFFGQEERPEIASYCFDVLSRKLAAARKVFSGKQSKRLKRSTLIARADAYCEGWVNGVYRGIKEFAMPPDEQERINRHFEHLRSKQPFGEGKIRDVGNTREKGDMSRYVGYCDGRQVKLNHGVNGQEIKKLGVQ